MSPDLPNYLTFLVALDDHIRTGNVGYVPSGHMLLDVAQAAGLVEWGDEAPVHWVGQFVHDGYPPSRAGARGRPPGTPARHVVDTNRADPRRRLPPRPRRPRRSGPCPLPAA